MRQFGGADAVDALRYPVGEEGAMVGCELPAVDPRQGRSRNPKSQQRQWSPAASDPLPMPDLLAGSMWNSNSAGTNRDAPSATTLNKLRLRTTAWSSARSRLEGTKQLRLRQFDPAHLTCVVAVKRPIRISRFIRQYDQNFVAQHHVSGQQFTGRHSH